MNKYGVQIDIEVLDLLDTTSRQKEVFFLSSLFPQFQFRQRSFWSAEIIIIVKKFIFLGEHCYKNILG